MSDQALFRSFDSLSLSGHEPSSRLSPPASGDAGLRDAFSAPNSAPLDSTIPFSAFHLPSLHEGGDAPMGASRFQHLFANGAPVDAAAGHSDSELLPPHLAPVGTRPASDMGAPFDERAGVYGGAPPAGGAAGAGTSAGASALPGGAPPLRGSASFPYANPWGMGAGGGASGAQLPLGMGAAEGTGASLGAAGAPPPLQLGAGPLRFGGKPPNPSGEADIIPTAIVIKNIPFNIKREQLLQVIRDLGIPVPYAFNYHFDQGIFRGLAFANFHTASEANEVVAALNGLDVSGRKLRVEYKKVLQAGEKERIEKEKALKRMQYAQTGHDKERKKDKSMSPEMPAPLPTGAALNGLAIPKDGAQRKSPTEPSSPFFPRVSGDVSSGNGTDGASLDLNDASTLEIYSRVLLFKDDRMRDELAFSRSLTAAERRVVHLVAQKLGLYHYTMGAGDDRHVLVTKTELPGNEPPSAGADLRLKKSAPDLKRAHGAGSTSPDLGLLGGAPGGGSSGHGLLAVPNAQPASHRSTSSLRDSFGMPPDPRFEAFGNGHTHEFRSPPPGSAGSHIFASPFDIPVVPSLARPSSVDIDRLDQYRNPGAPGMPSMPRPPSLGRPEARAPGSAMSLGSEPVGVPAQPFGPSPAPGSNNSSTPRDLGAFGARTRAATTDSRYDELVHPTSAHNAATKSTDESTQDDPNPTEPASTKGEHE